MKKNFSTILLLLVLFIGISLMLYPTFSDYWNSLHQSKAIAGYAEKVAQLDTDRYTAHWTEAETYNRELPDLLTTFELEDEHLARYKSLLDLDGSGIMGYVEIPSINVSLPVYHGTADSVLQIAVGHLEWTSLPVGGESSHCVISGHRGLPSAKLFTDLDRLVVGDVFLFRVLDEVLTYEVDQILIVEPNDTDALHIVEGEDLCTLLTCTPYGINSHRLLVRGHRIDNLPEARTVTVTADAVQVMPGLVAVALAVPMLLVLFIVLLIPKRRKL